MGVAEKNSPFLGKKGGLKRESQYGRLEFRGTFGGRKFLPLDS